MAESSNETDAGARPLVELFVKAAVDKLKSGGCPLCHRYFLACYLLRQYGYTDLVVTTFLPENPPKEVLAFSNGRHFPLLKVHRGHDAHGQSMAGIECDSVDEIEHVLDKFDCDEMKSRRLSSAEDKAERAFEDLYQKFNLLLRSSTDETHGLLEALDKLNSYLESNGTKYMLGDELSRADCYLLPSLQHVRVAGKAYRNFDIPLNFTHIWQYLANAYHTDAFLESCPADREIIAHYETKAQRPVSKKSQLMGDDRTLSLPK